MMQGVVERGTGRIVRRMGFKHPAAGKTGTTNEFKDAWFNGFTKDISTSVWVGFDNNNSQINENALINFEIYPNPNNGQFELLINN